MTQTQRREWAAIVGWMLLGLSLAAFITQLYPLAIVAALVCIAFFLIA